MTMQIGGVIGTPVRIIGATSSAVAGTAPANATVTIRRGGTVLGTATANGSGAWSYTVSGGISPGDVFTAAAPVLSAPFTVAPPAPSIPVNTVAPIISGAPQVGQTLTLPNGTWTGSPTGYAKQWFLDGTPISGATSSTYTLVTGQETKTVTGRVTATNAAGSASVMSAGVMIQAAVQPLAISGEAPATGTVGFPYVFRPTVTGGTGANRSATLEGSILAGQSFSSTTGEISGSPSSAGVLENLKITVSEPGLTPVTLSLQKITIVAGAASQTPFTIAPGKVLAWFDATDVATLFQENGSPIVPNGTLTQRSIGEIRAKTPANMAGDPAWPAVQATQARKPAYSATAYAGGLAPGIAHAEGQLLCMRNKPIGGTNTLTVIASVRLAQPGAIASLELADIRGGLSGRYAGGALYSDQGGYVSFQSGGGGEIGTGTSLDVTHNFEFAADSGTYRVYQDGTQIVSGAASNVFDNPLDFSIFNDGGYQNDGVTVSRPTSGAIGSWQHIILLSAPLSPSERIAMQAWQVQKAGGLDFEVMLDPTATTGSITAGSNVLTVPNGAGLTNGKVIGIEATTGYGTKGPGGDYWPGQERANEVAVFAETFSRLGTHMAAADTGKVYVAKDEYANITCSMSNGVLTITQVKDNPIKLGAQFLGEPVDYISSQISGTPGGVGTYQMTGNQTFASTERTLAGGGGFKAWDPVDVYTNRTIPRPMYATIQSGGGTTNLTLSRAAVNAVTGAGVKVDNSPVADSINGPENAKFKFVGPNGSEGPFHFSRRTLISNKKNWTFTADPGPDGKPVLQIKSFRGDTCAFFTFFQSISPTFENLWMIGNHGSAGTMGLGAGPSADYGSGLVSDSSTDTVTRNCRADDLVDLAFGVRYPALGTRGLKGSDGTTDIAYLIDLCHATRSTYPERYLQWLFNRVGGTATGEFRDCSFDSNWLTSAFECFDSSIGSNRIIRFRGRNSYLSQNTCDNFLFEDCEVTINPMSRGVNAAAPPDHGNPIVNINNNSGNLSTGSQGGGGIIRRGKFVIEGHIDAQGNVPRLVVLANPGVLIEGNYNPAVKDDGQRGGLYRAPYPAVGHGVRSASRAQIAGAAGNTAVKNVRVQSFPYNGSVATDDTYSKEFSFENAVGKDTIEISNTISGGASASVSPGLLGSGNVSNANYAALP